MNILGIIISTGVSSIVSILVGMAISATIGRKLSQVQTDSDKRRERRIQLNCLVEQWRQLVSRIIHLLIKHALGEAVNGELREADNALYSVEKQKKDIEAQYMAEAQEG